MCAALRLLILTPEYILVISLEGTVDVPSYTINADVLKQELHLICEVTRTQEHR